MSGHLRHSVGGALLPHEVPLRLTATDHGDYFALLTQTDPQKFARRISVAQFVPNIFCNDVNTCAKWGTKRLTHNDEYELRRCDMRNRIHAFSDAGNSGVWSPLQLKSNRIGRIPSRIFTSYLGCNVSVYLQLWLKSKRRFTVPLFRPQIQVIKTSFDGRFDGKVWRH